MRLFFIRSVFAVFLLGFAASCKQELPIEDGVIPSEYQSLVNPWLGSFSGYFYYQTNPIGSRANLLIGQDSANRLVVRIHENPEFNYLGLTCGSQIGRLLKIIDADGTRSSLTLQFAFTPGNCIQVAGRTLDLELRKSNSNSQVIFARLLKNFELRYECTTTIGNDIGGLKPITQCEWKRFPVYYQGLFRR